MFIVKLVEKNRVIIPRKIRVQLQMNSGKQLRVMIVNQNIMLAPSRPITERDDSHVTLDSRGRIVLPTAGINSLGIKKGNLLKASLLADKVLLSPIKLASNTLHIARLNADYRITIPTQLLQALEFPKKLFLTPIPDSSKILLSTADAHGAYCCPIRSDKRITINKKILSKLNTKPVDAITLTINPNPKLIIEETNHQLDLFNPR